MIRDYPEIIIIAVCLLVQGAVSMAEAALVSVDKVRIRSLAEAGDARAARLDRITDDRHALLTTLVIFINVCLLTVSGVLTKLVFRLLGNDAERWLTWISLGMIFVMLAFFEVTPKAIALRHPERLAFLVARPVAALMWLLGPPIRLLTAAGRGIIRAALVPLLGGQAEPTQSAFTEEEIRQLLAVGEETGQLDADERDMLDAAIEFSDKVAREIMVPRTDMVALDADAPLSEAVRVGAESGFSRIPVFRGDLDHVVGVLFVRDLMPHLAEGRHDVRVSALMRPAYFVPESRNIDDLLRDMQGRRAHMAVIIDEYGGVSGLVTIEDILEEIVGEIRDEYDGAEEEAVRMLDADTALVLGRATPDDVMQAFGVDLPEGEFDTVGGLMLDRLGRLPEGGDEVQCGSLVFVVEEVHEQRIQRIRVMHTEEPASDDEDTHE